MIITVKCNPTYRRYREKLSGPTSKLKKIIYITGSQEFPTLLHFAAKWGLENFAMHLVECPGGDRACEIRNSNSKLPADLAESAGFSKLATSLRSFSVILIRYFIERCAHLAHMFIFYSK